MKQLRGIELKRFNKKTEKHNKDIVLIMENIQYARNVASLFRTADACKVSKIILVGISHKPPFGKDLKKVSRNKETSVQWEYQENSGKAINKMKDQGYEIIGLEITDESIDYREYKFPNKLCLVVGNETYGIVKNTIARLDKAIFIPMYGKGASINVSTASSIALFKIIE